MGRVVPLYGYLSCDDMLRTPMSKGSRLRPGRWAFGPRAFECEGIIWSTWSNGFNDQLEPMVNSFQWSTHFNGQRETKASWSQWSIGGRPAGATGQLVSMGSWNQ